MNEKQAKRLRGARTAYIKQERPGMSLGPRAVDAADKLADIVRAVWPRITSHKGRGKVSALLRTGRLQDAAALCTGAAPEGFRR